jgi:chemotaxis protein methyltransferase CheR
LEEPQPPIQGSRAPRKVRDTVVMYRPEVFESLGIQNIPIPEYEELAALILKNFGIKVGENKRTLVTGRVHPMMDKYGFADHREFLTALYTDKTGVLLSELANRISTNHTAFYREDAHFDVLRGIVLPDLVRRKCASGDRDLRIWCAASATGEEPYTILFTLMKYFGADYAKWHAGVLATDISAEALETARKGLYNETRVIPVPKDALLQFFNRVDQDTYEVKPELRKEITFRRLNLTNDIYPFKQRFDIIFCRNVMIYFTRTLRENLLMRMHDWLLPGGCLFIGHSESLVGSHEGYEYVAPAVYRRK